MKVIHCADLHLDSSMKTFLATHQANERKKEILLTFERMLRFARNEEVKVIIIAGDMFDTEHVSLATKNRIFDLIRDYNDIDFLYLSGNHDEENMLGDISNDFDNLKVFGSNWTEFSYDNVSIVGTRLDKYTSYDTLNLDENRKNIVVLHGQISKYNVLDSIETIPLPKLKDKNIDYLALGHIHSFECDKLDGRGVYCYAGCLEGRGFDECGEKGFVLIDINDTLDYKFIPFASRELKEVVYDISNHDNWFAIEKCVEEEIKDIDTSALIKITLTGRYPLSMNKNIELFLKKLNTQYYFVKIKDETKLRLEEKDYLLDMSLKGEFIRKVMASNLSQEDKDAVILMGIKSLEGEDLV